MHEYSLVLSLIERAEQEARARAAKSVAKIKLLVGEYSGVEGELLAQAFEIARTGTCCSNAELQITKEPSTWSCPKCKARLSPDVSLRCGHCDCAGELTEGASLILEQLELEI